MELRHPSQTYAHHCGALIHQFATSLKSASWLFLHSLSQGMGPSRSKTLMCSCTFYDYHAGIPKGYTPNRSQKIPEVYSWHTRMLRTVGPIESEQLDIQNINWLSCLLWNLVHLAKLLCIRLGEHRRNTPMSHWLKSSFTFNFNAAVFFEFELLYNSQYVDEETG